MAGDAAQSPRLRGARFVGGLSTGPSVAGATSRPLPLRTILRQLRNPILLLLFVALKYIPAADHRSCDGQPDSPTQPFDPTPQAHRFCSPAAGLACVAARRTASAEGGPQFLLGSVWPFRDAADDLHPPTGPRPLAEGRLRPRESPAAYNVDPAGVPAFTLFVRSYHFRKSLQRAKVSRLCFLSPATRRSALFSLCSPALSFMAWRPAPFRCALTISAWCMAHCTLNSPSFASML